MTPERYRCSGCGEVHSGFPDLCYDAPIYFDQIPETERSRRCELTSDTCVLDHEHFFIRAVLEIPILGREDRFGWGVWVSLREINFHRYLRFVEVDPPEGEGPYFGWLSNRLPVYEDTLNLKTHVHLRPAGTRPLIELEHTDHALARHQHHGIEPHELSQIVAEATRMMPGVFASPTSARNGEGDR
jgi:hypothetical protein